MRTVDLKAASELLDFSKRIDSAQRAEEQLQGAVALHNLLATHRCAYLADEVGMGKTYVALGVLEPANVAVLFEMKKPQPDGEVIARLMKRFVYTAGITGAMQIATLVIMTRVASL